MRKLAFAVGCAVVCGCAKVAPAPAIVSTSATSPPAVTAPSSPVKGATLSETTTPTAAGPAKTASIPKSPNVLMVNKQQVLAPVPKPSTAKVVSSWRERSTKKFHLNSTMELLADNTFRWDYEGIPMTGAYKRNGNTFTLTVQTALGQPIEIIQAASGNGLKLLSENLKAQLDPSSNKLNLFGSGSKEAAVIFQPGKPDEVGPKSVTAEEAPLVAEFSGRAKMDGIGVTDEAQQQAVEDSLQDMKLVLRSDNTFKMDMIVRFGGRWHVEKNKLYLEVPVAFDIMQEGRVAGRQIVFEISSENRVLVTKREDPPVQMVFVRK